MKRLRVALLALVCSVACNRTPEPASAPAPKDEARGTTVRLTPEGFVNAAIETRKIVPGAFAPRVRLSGAIAGDPKHIAQVGARVSGRVAQVRVALGDWVKRGQPLMDVDTIEFHQTVLEYRTAAAKARATHDTLARQRQLVEERVGAEQDLRRAEADAAAADAALGEAREHLKFLGLSDADVGSLQAGGESKSRITSPIDGRVSSLAVTLGQALTGNETVAVVADLDAVWGQLRVYELDLAQVRVGAPAAIEVPAYPGKVFDGKVEFISDVLDPASRSADVRVSLANPDGSLKPGMGATALVSAPAGDALWLPATAVQPYNGAQVVFVSAGERTFASKPVVVGEERGGFVPVSKGINTSDEVVIQGAFALRSELERASFQGD